MDIHRCRFVDYKPSAINALAFSHPSSADTKKRNPPDLRLALGRDNGDVELWNPSSGNWYQETIFRGAKDRSIGGLAWTQSWLQDDESALKYTAGRLRLFSVGNSTSITEWDLERGTPARHADGNFGDLWCLAAQPRWSPPNIAQTGEADSASPQISQYLAAGCSDGTIVLFTTEDDDLRFAKTLGKPPTKKPRVISLAWKDRNILVAGYDDSTIRVYDVRNRSTLRNMSLGKPGNGQDSIFVWAVKCLPNGTIVSGDSTGQLKIWDAKNYSLVQTLQGHKSDILDIETSTDGKLVITAGADRRTIAYNLSAPEKGQPGHMGQRWSQIMHRRYHAHDVKALASYEGKGLSVCVSGGVDTVPVVLPLKELGGQYHRSLSHLPQRPQVHSAKRQRLVVTWADRQVNLWYIIKPQRSGQTDEGDPENHANYELAAKIMLKGDENIASAHVSASGKLLVVATVAGVKLFQLKKRQSGEGRVGYRTRQVEVHPTIANFGVKLVQFSPDCRWLSVVRLDNTVVMAKFEPAANLQQRPRIVSPIIKLARPSHKAQSSNVNTSLGQYLETICSIAFSSDSRIFAIGDISGYVDTWLLQRYEDTQELVGGTKLQPSDSESADSENESDDDLVVQGQKWIRNPAGSTLPKLGGAILVLSFCPRGGEASQQLTTANGQAPLHPTRHNPHPHSHDLPSIHSTLVAVTPDNSIFEFDIGKGKLSDWSRRNPPSSLPEAMRMIKDPAMGCFWGEGEESTRLWLYGSVWLFMLDLSQDLPERAVLGRLGDYDVVVPENDQKKRKRGRGSEERFSKHSTGAGDNMRAHERLVGLGRHMLKSSGAHDMDHQQVVDMHEYPSPVSDEDDEGPLQLASISKMRREGLLQMPRNNDEAHSLANGDTPTPKSSKLPLNGESVTERPGHWLCLQYRSILGIVPLDGPGSDAEDIATADDVKINELEVAIIERPLFEVASAFEPRFEGSQDWDV